MRNYKPARNRSLYSNLIVGGSAVGLLSIGMVVTLWLLGVDINPFATKVVEDPYMVRIPINAQPIAAYSRVDRAHLLDPRTSALMVQKVPPNLSIGMAIVGIDANGSRLEGKIKNVKNVNGEVVFVLTDDQELRQAQTLSLGGAILDINGIIGRVVKRDKRAGLGFNESTFFPLGTPEGIAGAIPEGMRAITIDATKLSGVHSLNSGDEIDLMANLKGDPELESNGNLVSSSAHGQRDIETEPVLLANKAIVLKPVFTRNEASTSSSLTQGTRVQNIPKYEISLAMRPDDVISLQRALNRSMPIVCIVHSGKPASQDTASKESNLDDEVEVPVTVKSIFAYDVVSRDAFVSPATRSVKLQTLSKSTVERLGIITSLEQCLGTIARNDIRAGSYLRQSDLLSGSPQKKHRTYEASSKSKLTALRSDEDLSGGQLHEGENHLVANVQQDEAVSHNAEIGDRPSITSFIPPHHTAFAIPWNRVYGSEHLQIGDRVDLMASFSLNDTKVEEEKETRPDGTTIERKTESTSARETQRTWGESFGFRAEPWFVATDAIVIAPVGFPAPASAIRTLGDQVNRSSNIAKSNDSFNGPPIILAIEDRDVELTIAALASKDALLSVAFHSSERSIEEIDPRTRDVVILPESIDAYERFDETVWKGHRRRMVTRQVDASDDRFADAIATEDISQYFGRILNKSKLSGECLTAEDFLPIGAMEGLSAGAAPGRSLFTVADTEIEGLDNMASGDAVAILTRKTISVPKGLGSPLRLASSAASEVVVDNVRIARASFGKQTVLDIANSDLTILQAALAQSLKSSETADHRSQLIAVAKSIEPKAESPLTDQIKPFDPLAKTKFTEVIVGRTRSVHAFHQQ